MELYHLKCHSLTFLFPLSFIPFTCPLVRISSTVLNRLGQWMSLFFFLPLIEIIHVFLHLEMVLTMDLLYIIAFTMLQYICYVHRSSRSFIMRIFWILSKIFLDLKDDHFVLFCFLLLSLFISWITFFGLGVFIHFWTNSWDGTK